MKTQKVLYRGKGKRNKNSTILLAFLLLVQVLYFFMQYQDISLSLGIFYWIGILSNIFILLRCRKTTTTFLWEKDNSVLYMDILLTMFSSLGIFWRIKRMFSAKK